MYAGNTGTVTIRIDARTAASNGDPMPSTRPRTGCSCWCYACRDGRGCLGTGCTCTSTSGWMNLPTRRPEPERLPVPKARRFALAEPSHRRTVLAQPPRPLVAPPPRHAQLQRKGPRKTVDRMFRQPPCR